jgi:hypothetical protein
MSTTEMRELTKDERAATARYMKAVGEGIVDVLLHGRGDAIFEDWATNLLYATNEDTSLSDHIHLACLDTADRYHEGIERVEERLRKSGQAIPRDTVPEHIRLGRIRANLMRAGTRLVALETGLVADDEIEETIGEVESLLAGAGEEWTALAGS